MRQGQIGEGNTVSIVSILLMQPYTHMLASHNQHPHDATVLGAHNDTLALRQGACAQSAGLSLHPETSYATVGAAK